MMVMYKPRRHGWQLPLHRLQIVGMVVYLLLVVVFYSFVGPFLGNRIATITVLSIFSSIALSVAVLFIRCTATDPSDKARFHRKTRKIKKTSSSLKLNYGYLLGQIVVRAFRRMERKVLKTCIRRKYLVHPRLAPHVHLQPLLPFPLVTKDDYDHQEDLKDLSFCYLCNFQVHKHSKHCRTCNRCVEGFDHHCRWLNNCVGKKNYSTFILLMISVLLMLLSEAGTAIAVFIRCFADKKRIELELSTDLHVKFPRGLLIAFSVILFVITTYGCAALGQLFFFHILLIRKGMRTYDYIVAMKEAHQFNVSHPFSDSDFSSDDDYISEPDSLTRPIVMSPERLAVRIDTESGPTSNQSFRPSIDPWKLIQMSKEKAFMAKEKAKEKVAKEKQTVEHELLNPLPLEMKRGPLVLPERDLNITPLLPITNFPGRLSSPRRRFSGSPNQKFRNKFDLKITEVSSDLESYISRQVLCTVLRDESQPSPR